MFNFNPTTGGIYGANNQETLMNALEENEFTTGQWAGFKQWLEKGYCVKKGQKAVARITLFVDKKIKADDKKAAKAGDDVAKKKVMLTKAVFNFDQVEKIAEFVHSEKTRLIDESEIDVSELLDGLLED